MGLPKYTVTLSDDERTDLRALLRRGTASARRLTRARILLKADEARTDGEVAEVVGVGVATVHRIRQRCVEEGLEAALGERRRKGAPPKFTPKQHAHVIALACSTPPGRPGAPARYDYEYTRAGVANVFVVCEPHRGWRHLSVTTQRCKSDFAQQMRWLVTEGFPRATVIRVVLDNLRTHTWAALYETFPADAARRLARTLEFHYTPTHGSWLNMAEIELSVLSRDCLARRIATPEILAAQVALYQHRRNAAAQPIEWRFTCDKARLKLHRLYPSPSL